MKKLADIFPAVIAIAPPNSIDINEFTPRGQSPQGTRRVDRSRIIVTADTLLIAIDSDSGPKTVFKERCTFYSKGDDKVHRAITDTGKIISFRKENNCRCGSRLVGWNPFKEINNDSI